jgi:hypothetical protein
MDDEHNGRRGDALASRGVTRVFAVSDLNDPRRREAGFRAVHLINCLRLYLHGPEGIGVIMGGRHALADITGMDGDDLDMALEGATAGPNPLLRVEGQVYWVVNALEAERYLNIRDRKHRLRIQRGWDDLPNCSLKEQFRDYYADWWEDPSEAQRRPLRESEKGLGRALKGSGQGLVSSVAKLSEAKRSEEKTSARAQQTARDGDTPAGGWPAKVAEVLSAIAPVTPGRVGKTLQPVVDKEGEALVLQAAEWFVKRARAAPVDEMRRWEVATFFRQVGLWVESVKPGSGRRAIGDTDPDPPPERSAPPSTPTDPAPVPTSRDEEPVFLRGST